MPGFDMCANYAVGMIRICESLAVSELYILEGKCACFKKMEIRSLSSSVSSHLSRALRDVWFILFSDLTSYFVQQHFQIV